MSRHWLLVMTRLQLVILFLLPLCSGQFSIQGPSDGSRRSQGLKYSREKGIEYDDQRASLGAGDFSIQGASDGNSDFTIQGASDGNSDFQIQGATDGNANFQIQGATDGNANFQIQGATDGNANFQIQGATDSNDNFRIQGPTDSNAGFRIQGASDGHGQSAIQGPYDGNQGGGRALQYRDPSGLSVNWKSYQQSAPQHPQQIQQPTHNAFIPHDAVPQQAPRRRQQGHRQQQHHQQQQQQVQQPQPQPQRSAQPEEQPIARPNYKPFDNAPPQIKQLLQFQQQIPYLNIIPEQYRYDAINNQDQGQDQGQEPVYQKPQKARAQPDEANQYRSQYRGKSKTQSRNKRQTNQRQNRRQDAQAQHRETQPPVEAQPQYSTNVPSGIQELLKFQAQIPYVNHIPEKWRYDALAAAQNQRQEVIPQQRNYAPQSQNQDQHREKRQAPQYRQPRQQQQQHQSQLLSYNQQHQQQQPARQQQQQQQQPQYQRISQPPAEPQPHYSTNLPSQLQNLLKFQAQIPYVNSIPEKFRYENLAAAQVQHGGQQVQSAPANQYRPQYNAAGDGQSRQKRQAPHYQQQQRPQQHQQQQQQQPQYQRISQPPAEPQPQYSPNVPGSIKKLLEFQSQTPYNIIANQIIYRPDKPYVPQPVQAVQPTAGPQYQQPQHRPLIQPQYQGQAGHHQGQGQVTYGQAQGVRPVTENQY